MAIAWQRGSFGYDLMATCTVKGIPLRGAAVDVASYYGFAIRGFLGKFSAEH